MAYLTIVSIYFFHENFLHFWESQTVGVDNPVTRVSDMGGRSVDLKKKNSLLPPAT